MFQKSVEPAGLESVRGVHLRPWSASLTLWLQRDVAHALIYR